MKHIIMLSTVAATTALLSAFTTPPPAVLPVVETDPVPDAGDAADDPAIWVHPRDPSQSLVIGTNKRGGLAVYDLGGSQIQYLPVGEVNNADVRDGFLLGGRAVALVGASHVSGKAIRLFTIDPETRHLSEAPGGTIAVGVPKPYGFCFYRSAKDQALYAFVSDHGGTVEQWKLDGVSGTIIATRARTIPIATQTEGLVADDELGWLYASEEKACIWRYPAEPGEPAKGVIVDRVGKKDPVVPDAEGLALWKGTGGQGYLLISSQGNSTIAVYGRTPPNTYLGSFSVGASASIDAVTGTDGIEVCSTALGAAFPSGMLVVQDNDNTGRNQNFKFVPWEHVARAFRPALRLRP